MNIIGNQEETCRGIFDWAVTRLMAFYDFKSLLGCLIQLNPDVLLNNFSKSYPNLSPIANAKMLQRKKMEIIFLKKMRKREC
jgi:hypothetical protein